MSIGVTYRSIIAGSFIAAMVACAKQGSPSGGPKDTTPPVVLKTIPVNGATSFRGKTITITFDEYVALDKINDKFMMSPPVSKRPQINIRGKSVVVTIDEQLRDSTTYTLYFQDAIRDLNEGNILENYQFVFSTGKYIDSLSYAGMVLDAFTLEVPDRMMVMLHSNLSDTAPLKVIPDYISLTGPAGYFTINNLRPGTYRLYALKDNNTNRKYEPGDEHFAFAVRVTEITPENNSPLREAEHEHPAAESDSAHIHSQMREPDQVLYSFISSVTKYYLVSSVRRSARLLEYTLSRPPDTLRFSFEAEGISADEYFTESSVNGDTIRIWLKDSTVYNMPVITTKVTFPFTSQGDSLIYRTDTIPMRYIQPRAPRGGRQQRFVSLQTSASRAGIPPGRDIKIFPDVPLKTVDFSKFRLLLASDSLREPLPFNPLFDTLVPREITLKHNLAEGADYILEIPPGAVRSIYGETNDTTSFGFRVRTKASFGTLTVKLTGYEGKVVVQLLDQREKIIAAEKAISPGKVLFNFIENGTYRLKVIYDEDGNGEWTTGDFAAGRQPEKVSYFPEELEIKSNWDLEQVWNVEGMNQKAEILRLKKPQQR